METPNDSLEEPLLVENSAVAPNGLGLAAFSASEAENDLEAPAITKDTPKSVTTAASKDATTSTDAPAFEPLETVETAGGDESTQSRCSCMKTFLLRWICKWQYVLMFPMLLTNAVASAILDCKTLDGSGYVSYPFWSAALLFFQFVVLWWALLLLPSNRPLLHRDVAATYISLSFFVLRGEFIIFRHSNCFFDDFFYAEDMWRLVWLSIAIQAKKMEYLEDNERKQQLLVIVCALLSICSLDLLAAMSIAAVLCGILFRLCPCCRSPVAAVGRLEAEYRAQELEQEQGQAVVPAGEDAEAVQARLERQIAQLGGPVGAGAAFLEQEIKTRNRAFALLCAVFVLRSIYLSFGSSPYY